MNEMQSRPPLTRPDGPLLPWKTDTSLRRQLLALSEFVPVLLMVEAALKTDDPGVSYACYGSYRYVDITPKDDAHARRIVGKLIRKFKENPKIVKPTEDTMESVWQVEGCAVTVKGYLQKTCRYEEIEVDMPAEPEKVETVVTAAKPARKEKRRVIVCDEAKAEPQSLDEVAAAAPSEEVPF